MYKIKNFPICFVHKKTLIEILWIGKKKDWKQKFMNQAAFVQ